MVRKNGDDPTETTLGDVVRAIVHLGDRVEAGQTQTNQRLDQTNQRLDQTNQRLDGVAAAQGETNTKVEILTTEVRGLGTEVRGLAAQGAVAMRKLTQHEERIRKLESTGIKPPRAGRRR